MCLELKSLLLDANWEKKACKLKGKSMIIGDLYGVNVPEIDYFKIYI